MTDSLRVSSEKENRVIQIGRKKMEKKWKKMEKNGKKMGKKTQKGYDKERNNVLVFSPIIGIPMKNHKSFEKKGFFWWSPLKKQDFFSEKRKIKSPSGRRKNC